MIQYGHLVLLEISILTLSKAIMFGTSLDILLGLLMNLTVSNAPDMTSETVHVPALGYGDH
jgi:hypothetical protein